MKLTELKQATRHLHLVDLDHEFTVGKTQYKMGIDISSCRNDSQRKGWTVGKGIGKICYGVITVTGNEQNSGCRRKK